MAEIKWDRETCVRCSMVISDRRFAAQLRGGPKNTVFKFDDIGCFAFWIRDHLKTYPWLAIPRRACGSPTSTARASK
jgi:copper chaperone NosL